MPNEIDESKAPQDRLFESGCRLCGEHATFRLGIESGSGRPIKTSTRANVGAYLCNTHASSRESATASDAEITRRLALRSTPTPAPSFKVGDRVSGIGWGFGPEEERGRRTGTIASFVGTDEALLETPGPWSVHRSSLRHEVSPAHPSPVARPCCPRCGANDLNRVLDKCDDCGVTGKQLREQSAKQPVEPARVDQYAEHRAGLMRDLTVTDVKDLDSYVAKQTSWRQPSKKRKQALDQLGNNHVLRVSRHSAGMDTRQAKKPSRGYVYHEAWATAGWEEDS